MNNYCCNTCGVTHESNSTTSINGCQKSTFHTWTNLGLVGDKTFLCKNCGIKIHSKSTPSLNGCPNKTFHSWNKL